MPIREEIIDIIKEKSAFPAAVTDGANLYRDVKMDSFSFIKMLLEIEEKYDITFGLSEMEECLAVGRLIELVEIKIRRKNEGKGRENGR